MANFDNKNTPKFAEENDMELNLDELDGVSGGVYGILHGSPSDDELNKDLYDPLGYDPNRYEKGNYEIKGTPGGN